MRPGRSDGRRDVLVSGLDRRGRARAPSPSSAPPVGCDALLDPRQRLCRPARGTHATGDLGRCPRNDLSDDRRSRVVLLDPLNQDLRQCGENLHRNERIADGVDKYPAALPWTVHRPGGHRFQALLPRAAAGGVVAARLGGVRRQGQCSAGSLRPSLAQAQLRRVEVLLLRPLVGAQCCQEPAEGEAKIDDQLQGGVVHDIG